MHCDMRVAIQASIQPLPEPPDTECDCCATYPLSKTPLWICHLTDPPAIAW